MNTKLGTRTTTAANGQTNWEAIRAMPESDIEFTRDAPQTAPADWANAVAHRGLPLPAKKEQISLRVDADVIQWFRAQGIGWQTRMNAVLKAYSQAMGRQNG